MFKFNRYPLFWKLTLPAIVVNLIWGSIIVIAALEMKESRVQAFNLYTQNVSLLLQLQTLEGKFSHLNQLFLMHVASTEEKRLKILGNDIHVQQKTIESDLNQLEKFILAYHAHSSAEFLHAHQAYYQYFEKSAEIIRLSENLEKSTAIEKLQKLISDYQAPINDTITGIITLELNFMEKSYEQSQDSWQKDISTLAGAGGTAFLLTFAFLYRIINRITRRMSQVVACADTLSKGDLSARVPKDGCEDEISRIGDGLGAMAAEIELSTDLLLESESQVRMLLNSTAEAIYGIDVAGHCTFSNKACLQLLGYDSASELLGQNIHNLIHYAHADGTPYPAAECPVHSSIWTGQVIHRDEEVLWRKDGSNFRAEYWAHPIEKDGEVIGAVISFLDVTERSLTEEALQRSIYLLNEAQGIGHVGSWEWDIKKNTISWTSETYRIFGFTPHSVMVTYDLFLQRIHQLDRELVQQAVQDSLNGRGPYDINHRIVLQNGAERIVNEKGQVQYDTTGNPVAMIGTVQDITEIKKIEENLLIYQENLEDLVSERTMALQTAKEEADRANQAKSLFLSSMSHELRTPLNSILGFGQLLATDNKNPCSLEQKEYLQKILKSGTHLLHLIDDVLNLSKIESGAVEISLEPVDAYSVLLDTIELVQEIAKKHDVEILHEEPDKHIFIDVDNTRFRQIMMNLLSNAIKYNRPNGTVSLSCRETDGWLRLMVSDTGIGIDSEKSKLLFEPFCRLGAETASIEGTGIGLTITKRLVEFMNGRIGFASEVGKGSDFWVDFPIVPSQMETSSPVPKPKLAAPALPEGHYTILYVEDDPFNRDLLFAILARTPTLNLLTAENGAQGVEMAVQYKPDMVFMDIGLPDMDGFTALDQLRKNHVTANIPVVALSGDAMPMDIKKALDAGFAEYITKPMNIANLYQVLSDVIKNLPQPDTV